MTWCAFAVSLWVLFLDNVHCGKICKYEIKGIEGFHGEIKLDGTVYSSTPVFPIVFLVEGHPLSDWRYAVLQNSLEVQYFTVYSVLHNTNEIRAKKTVPVGVSEVLQIGPESVNECTFYLTVTVGPSVLETTKTSTVTTFMSTSTLMASTLPSTVREDSTAISTTAVTPTRTASFSSASSSQHTTEFVTPRDCRYEIQGMDGFDDEIILEGPIFIATTVFSIIFLKEGNPLPVGPYAILKNPQEVHYFTITINTNEIMAYRTVPLGTSEVLEISPESVDECTFYLTVTVGSSMTKTLVSTSGLTSSLFPTITPLSTITSVSQTGNIELSTTSSNPWTTESVSLGVCTYEIQDIEGFVGELNVDGPLFIVTTVFHIKFIMDGNPQPDSKRAVLKNHREVQYFTVTSNTNEIMAIQTVSVGTTEVLEISPDGVDECTFYLTVNVQDSVLTATAKTTSLGPKSSTTPPMPSSAFISMSVVSTVSDHPTTNSTKLTTIKSTSAKDFTTIISSALTNRNVTSKSMTSTLSTVPISNSSSLASFTLSTSVDSFAVSPVFFSGVVFRGAVRLISILLYVIIFSCS